MSRTSDITGPVVRVQDKHKEKQMVASTKVRVTRVKVTLAVVGFVLLGVGLAVAVPGLFGSEDANLTLSEFETVNADCLDNADGSDALPENASSEPTADGREVTVRYVVPTESKDAELRAELDRAGRNNGRPVYRLNVSTRARTTTADCEYGLLYEARIDVTPASQYTLKIYHDGEYEGKVARTGSGFISSSTERAPRS